MFRLETTMEVRGPGFVVLGHVSGVAVEPHLRVLTHVVVRLRGRHAARFLVPVDDLVRTGKGLVCSLSPAQVEALGRADELEQLEYGGWPHGTDAWDLGIVETVRWPYVGSSAHLDLGVHFDKVPKGDVEVAEGSEVFSRDHVLVGTLTALVLDDDWTVRAVVARNRRGLGHHETVIGASRVRGIDNDRVVLTLTALEVGAAGAGGLVGRADSQAS